jgi:hypothetical protein
MNLTTQEAQVACFGNAAAHLEPGGCFVIEVGVPALRLLPPGQTMVMYHANDAGCSYDTYDVATQASTSTHIRIGADGLAVRDWVPFRYVWPAELDLMAQLAGMRLRSRWADWSGEPFTSESTKHISIWEKPG